VRKNITVTVSVRVSVTVRVSLVWRHWHFLFRKISKLHGFSANWDSAKQRFGEMGHNRMDKTEHVSKAVNCDVWLTVQRGILHSEWSVPLEGGDRLVLWTHIIQFVVDRVDAVAIVYHFSYQCWRNKHVGCGNRMSSQSWSGWISSDQATDRNVQDDDL